jgi:hypothetical protein
MTNDAPDLSALRALPVSPRPAGYVTTLNGDALDRLVVARAAGWPDPEAVLGDFADAIANGSSPAALTWLDAVLGDRRKSGTNAAPDQIS